MTNFELVAGERRWRACAALERATIPAIVRETDDRDSLEVAIIENLQRENLNPIEEAAGFAQLIDEYEFTQEDVARRVGKSRPAIANALRLLALPDAIKAMLVDGRLTAGHGRALLAAPASNAARTRAACRERRSLGARAREAHRRGKRTATHVRACANSPPTKRNFESRLRERFGTHVALVRSGKGGTHRIALRKRERAPAPRRSACSNNGSLYAHVSRS